MIPISFIVPVYKVEAYIGRCLDSILAQTFTGWECILVDDGSPDQSGAICDEYAAKDSRFKVIHQVNSGAVAARCKALEFAVGQYFVFVDADDYIDENMIKYLYSSAIENNADMTACNVALLLPDNHVRNAMLPQFSSSHQALRDLLRGRLTGWLCNKLIKRSFWDSCDVKMDKSCSAMEDVYISVQLYANNPQLSNIDLLGYYYNRCNESSITAGVKHVLECIPNMIHTADYLKERGLFNLYEQDFNVWAMRTKMVLLRLRGINSARELFPQAHRGISSFSETGLKKIAFWFIFNTGFVGKIAYKILSLRLSV